MALLRGPDRSLEGITLEALPIAGDGPGGVVPGVLLAGFANLIGVATLAPLAGRRLRRRRPDLPRPVADNYAGTALLCAIAAVFVGLGLVHRPSVVAEHEARRAQLAAVHDYVIAQAPEYRAGIALADSLRLEQDLLPHLRPRAGPEALAVPVRQHAPAARRACRSTMTAHRTSTIAAMEASSRCPTRRSTTCSMYYEVHGEGPPLILLHGAYMTVDMMAPLATGPGRDAAGDRARDAGARPHRRRRPPDHLRADGRRHGRADRATSASSRPTSWATAWAAAIALQMAIRHPALVRRLVVASAGFRYDGMPAEALAMFPSITPEMFAGQPDGGRVPATRAEPGRLPDAGREAQDARHDATSPGRTTTSARSPRPR